MSSRRSAARRTLSAGWVIWAAISRARAMHYGVRIERRSATSDSPVLVQNRWPASTFSRLLTIAQAATRLNCSDKTVRRMIADGRLKAYRIGGRSTIRVDRNSLLALEKPMIAA